MLAFALLIAVAAIGFSFGRFMPLSLFGNDAQISPSFLIPASSHGRQNVRVDFGRLPLIFEQNQGQSYPQTKFLARGPGYGLFLTADEAVLVLQPRGTSSVSSAKKPSVLRLQLARAKPNLLVTGVDPLPGRSNYFIGNDPSRWRRDIPQFSRVRYSNVYPGIDLVYYGNQGRLEYDFELAPGADPAPLTLRFQGAENLLLDTAGNLALRLPGAEVQLHAPRVYQEVGGEQKLVSGHFVLRGQDQVGFALGPYDRSRALVIDPVLTYSTYLGGSGEEACPARIAIGDVASSPPPGCPGIAIDSALNIYIAGSTTSIDFPLTPQPSTTPPPSAFQTCLDDPTNPAPCPTPNGSPSDIFVTKLNASGSAIVFSTYLGGALQETSAGIAVDSGLRVVVAGTTTSADFPTTASAFQTTPASSGQHVFVSVLDPTGHTLVYSTYLSGNGTDTAAGLALDFRNKIYVLGATTSTVVPSLHSFPANLGAFQTCSSVDLPPAATDCGTNRFFLSKIDTVQSQSNSLAYSTYFSGGNPANGVATNETLGGGIAVDTAANVYITGGTNYLRTGDAATDFPILNAYQGCLNTPPTTTTTNCTNTASPNTDAFVAKFNPAASPGSQLIYSTYLGGSGNDVGNAIVADSGFNPYVTGWTTSTDFIIPAGITPFQKCLDAPSNPATCPTGVTEPDAFLAKLQNPCTGTSCTTTTLPLLYFSYLGGSDTDVGMGISLDPSAQSTQGARIAGWTNSPDFPLNLTAGVPIQQNFGGGQADAFVSRINTTAALATDPGNFGTYLGGSGADFGTAIATDSQGSIYVAGETASGNFPTLNPLPPNGGGLQGNTDAFVSKLSPISNLSFSSLPGVSPSPVGVGNPVTFSYHILNSGDTISNLSVTETFSPTLANFVSATASSASSSSSCTGAVSGTVQCNLGTIPAGSGAATVSLTVSPIAPSIPYTGSIQINSSALIGTCTPTNPICSQSATAIVNDYTVAASPTAPPPISAGSPATFTVTVTPTGNIPESVNLSVSGLPPSGTSTFPNGSSLSSLSSGAQSRELVVNTVTRVTTPASLWRTGAPFYATWLPISGMALLGLKAGRKTRKRLWLGVLLAGCLTFTVFQAACGSSATTSTTSGTPAGTYPLTITATSGTTNAAVRTVQVTLIVK